MEAKMGKDLKIANKCFKEIWEGKHPAHRLFTEKSTAYYYFLQGWTKSAEHYDD